GVEKVLALEVHAGLEAQLASEPFGAEERRGTTGVGFEQDSQLDFVRCVGASGGPGTRQLVERGDQRFRHEAATVLAEPTARVRRSQRFFSKNWTYFFHLKDTLLAASTNARTRAGSL